MLSLTLGACAPQPVVSSPAPGSIPISNDSGEIIASQPGPLWVLLSGVDEHGLMAEPQLTLHTDAGASAAPGPQINTGLPAAVREIRHLGPQGLQRFYRVDLVTGESGWISDYYVRRLGYLFNIEGTTVPVHASPGGAILTQLPNVTPVILVDPTDAEWWQISSFDKELIGWVRADYVKESSEEEFLLNPQHEHSDDEHHD